LIRLDRFVEGAPRKRGFFVVEDIVAHGEHGSRRIARRPFAGILLATNGDLRDGLLALWCG